MFDAVMPKLGRNPDQTWTPQCRSFDQTPTLASKFGRNFEQTSTLGGFKFGRNPDQTSTPPWSKFKFARSLVSQFGRHFFNKIIMSFMYIQSKLRPNFDIGGVEVWPKFGVSLAEVWSKFRHVGCRSLVGIPAKLRSPSAELWSKSRPNFDTPVSNICTHKLPRLRYD